MHSCVGTENSVTIVVVGLILNGNLACLVCKLDTGNVLDLISQAFEVLLLLERGEVNEEIVKAALAEGWKPW